MLFYDKTPMKKWLGYIYVIIAGTAFGFLGIFGRLAFKNGLSIGELLTWRFSSASILLFLTLLILKPRYLKISLKQFFISSCLGVFGYAIFSTMYFEAIKGVSVPLAAMLLFTFPIFVNAGAFFILKERLSQAQLLSLAIASIGLLTLLWGPIFVNSLQAVLYGLGSAIFYASYVMASGVLQKKVHPITSSLYVMIAAAVTLLLFHAPSIDRISHFNLIQVACILGLAIFCTITPLIFFLAGLQRISSSQASILAMIEPVVAVAASGLILEEHLSQRQLFGAILVLFGLIINATSKPSAQVNT